MKRIDILFFMMSMVFLYAWAQDVPLWVHKPSALYPESSYVSAVGSGQDRPRAEAGALGTLAAYFKQSVTSTVTITDTERQVNGRSTSDSRMSLSVEAAAAVDTLMGAEIKNTWHDGQNNTWYAVAVMEKARCRELYSGELDTTVDEITTLLDVSGGISFHTIRNCQKAQRLLGKAELYALILTLLDGPNRQAEISRINTVAADVLAKAQAIPVDVRVGGDVNGRLKAAFAEAFTAAGFKTGNRSSRFALEVAVTLAPVTLGKYFNTRYTVDAVLKDTQTGAELFTYNIANREAHPGSQTEADNRAIIGAERKITNDFSKILQEYLNSD
ncbi:MAG: LPP20 family lipoprotein [Spirochaetaceae bacterium]|jgi:hypothetical protein|nr:LPP20 family lipoprotein [Spirochaetaceae bacterium]